MSPGVLLAGLASGIAAAALVAAVTPSRPRLDGRVRPYTAAARSALGLPLDPAREDVPGAWQVPLRLLAPVVAWVAPRGTAALERRLTHSGLYATVPAGDRFTAHRQRQVLSATWWAVGGGAVVAALGRAPLLALLAGGLGAVVGAARPTAEVDRAIADRRERARAELQTVNHILAVHLRVGGSVVQALRLVVARSGGVVAGELREVLHQHRAGRPLAEALTIQAAATAEPQAARTYRLLASASAYGSDLAPALLRLAAEVREARREDLRRLATRRRAAVLIPIIALLAPVMLLFIAAPLPWLVLGDG